jgi:glutaredoxin
MTIWMSRVLLVAGLLSAAGPALALYKIVGPDGSVTYTDRPPVAVGAKVTTISRDGIAQSTSSDVGLPLDLRQATARFPVTLYTGNDCAPCDSGRQFLQQRGIPYSERRVTTEDDAAALERLVGGRTVPALTIGGQVLRGLSQADWTAYLDAAGYPRESRLPANWRAPAVAPLVERAVATPAPAAPAPEPTVAAPEPTQPESTLRF